MWWPDLMHTVFFSAWPGGLLMVQTEPMHTHNRAACGDGSPESSETPAQFISRDCNNGIGKRKPSHTHIHDKTHSTGDKTHQLAHFGWLVYTCCIYYLHTHKHSREGLKNSVRNGKPTSQLRAKFMTARGKGVHSKQSGSSCVSGSPRLT